jgi:hypothetical protein
MNAWAPTEFREQSEIKPEQVEECTRPEVSVEDEKAGWSRGRVGRW